VVTEFRTEIEKRIAATSEGLQQAREAGEHYLAEVHLGELESLARLAAAHGVDVDGVSEALAANGGTTPVAGIGRIDLHQADTAARHPA
jgi:hypothetical protein